MPTTGRTLRRERRSKDVSTVALAAAMNISRQTLWAIERALVVTPERITEYRSAVKTLADAKNEEAA